MEHFDLAFIDAPELEPQANESPKAYRAFIDYCNLGAGRSLRKLVLMYRAQSEDKASMILPPTTRPATLGAWCSAFGWSERSKLYEKLRAAAERQMELEALKEMKQRHIDFAMYLFKIAGQQLQAMALDPNLRLSPAEVRQFIETAVRIEREARGAADLAGAVNEANTMSAGVGGRFRVIEIVKDYGKPGVTDDDDDEDHNDE